MWEAIAGSTVGSAGSIFGQYLANEANQQLQEDTQNWNEKMWNMENKYNTPQAQMDRFRDAGLNPNLVLGQGGMTSGNSTGPPQSVPPPRMENMMQNFDPIGNYMQIKNQSAGIENIQSDTDNKKKDLELKEMDILLKGMDAKQKKWYLQAYIADYGDRRSQTKIETRIAQAELITKQINIDLSKANTIGQQLENQKQLIQLAYEDIKNTLEVANSYRNLKGTILQNKISKQEFNYMKSNKFKMGTTSALVGILTDMITGGQGTQGARQNFKIQLQRILQGKDRDVSEEWEWDQGGRENLYKEFGLDPPIDN